MESPTRTLRDRAVIGLYMVEVWENHHPVDSDFSVELYREGKRIAGAGVYSRLDWALHVASRYAEKFRGDMGTRQP